MDKDPAFVQEIDARASRGDAQCKLASTCLQAMRSVIHSAGCQASATAYFAAAVAALQKQLEQKGGEETTSALLLILHRSLPVVTPAVVHARMGDLVSALERALKASEHSAKAELARQVVGCFAAAANLAYDAGSRPNRKVLKPVFQLLSDKRIAVRQRAQLAACAIVRRAKAAEDQQSLDFASQHLVQLLAAAKPDRLAEELPAQRAVALLQACAEELPEQGLLEACMALVKLPGQLGQHPCCTVAFEFLANHFTEEEDEEEEEGDEAMATGGVPSRSRVDLAASVLAGLLQVPVSLLNVAYLVAYVRAIASATALLTSAAARGLAPRGVDGQKAKALGKLLELFSERDPTLLKRLREECLRVLAAAGEGGDLALLEAAPELCRPLLHYERKGTWQHSMPVMAGALDALAAARTTHVAPAEVGAWTAQRFQKAAELLKGLVAIRDKAKNAELQVFGKELEQCIGAAVSAFGPGHVLSVAPLELLEHSLGDNAFEQKSRSWLLLVLQGSCKHTSLAFFADKLLPLAAQLKARAAQAEGSSPLLAKKYTQLMEQVWALLPGLCIEPLDLPATMLADGGKLAKQLVAVLVNEATLRNFVWAAFAKLCEAVHAPTCHLAEELQAANKTCLQTLSGRVLPEMFSAFLKMHTEAEGQDESRTQHGRAMALNAVRSYGKLADPALVTQLFKTAATKLLKATAAGAAAQEAGVTPEQAVPLADIANALLPSLPVDALELAVKVFSPMLSSGAVTSEAGKATTAGLLQKAGYRAVAAVLSHPAAQDEQQLSTEKVLGFWPLLSENRQTCTAAALKGRLAAMTALLYLLEERLPPHFSKPPVRKAYLECVSSLLPEVLTHLRDNSTAVRDGARECLRVAVDTGMSGEMQTEMVTLVSAGLASLQVHSKAAAVDALSRLLYEHGAEMSGLLQERLINIVLYFVQDDSAQVWRAALKFVKVVVFVVAKENLGSYLKKILMLFESRHVATAKMLVRKIVERLVKVLPAEALAEAFPKPHAPLLLYIQKRLARQQRPKGALARGEDADEDEEEEAGEDASKGNRRAKREKGEKKEKKAKDAAANYDAFQEEDVDADEAPTGRKRRVRPAPGAVASKEPPTSGVMAHEQVQTLLDAWEAESDNEEGGKKRHGRRGGDLTGGGKRKRGEVEATTWIHEEKDVPLDFMSADAAHSVVTSRPAPQKRSRGNEADATNKTDALRRSGLTFANDGRLVVADTEDDGKEDGKDEEEGGKFSIGTHGGPRRPKAALSLLAGRRRAHAEAKAQARAEKRNAHQVKGLDIYAPTKKNAEGDAKRKGSKLQPYAYVRLNPKVTKEKFRNKAIGTFSKVITGAKAGVLKGMKAKKRDTKTNRTKADTRQKKLRRGKSKPAVKNSR